MSGQPSTWSSSLMPAGTPPKGLVRSARSAAARARSGSRKEKQFRSLDPMASSVACSSSLGERSPARNASTRELASPSHGVSDIRTCSHNAEHGSYPRRTRGRPGPGTEPWGCVHPGVAPVGENGPTPRRAAGGQQCHARPNCSTGTSPGRSSTSPWPTELGESFLSYSLSVITSRAIPDVRDGLKPVQRRILHAMANMGLRPDRPHRKCAGVVGETMGKYHPHGDGAIYDALTRMGQDFGRNITLVDPHGNFGSLDDPPAAYRYTECRLTEAAMEMLGEIDEDTVEFRPPSTASAWSPSTCPPGSPTCWSTAPPASPWAWPPTWPRHNLRRGPRGHQAGHDQAAAQAHRGGAHGRPARTGLPLRRRGGGRRPGGGLRHRPGQHPHPGHRRDRAT